MSHGKRSKAKGTGYERVICKRLSLWVSEGANEDLYWRSAMSGGRATVAGKRGKSLARQAGDITATAPEGHSLTDFFYIECKAYRNLGLDRFQWLGQGTLAKFWKDTKKQAALHRRHPMMIVKQNGFPSLVILAHWTQVEPRATFAMPAHAFMVPLGELEKVPFVLLIDHWKRNFPAIPGKKIERVKPV